MFLWFHLSIDDNGDSIACYGGGNRHEARLAVTLPLFRVGWFYPFANQLAGPICRLRPPHVYTGEGAYHLTL